MIKELSAPGGPSAASLRQILDQLRTWLQSLPPGTDPIRALETPGAWPASPITGTLGQPVFFALPSTLEFVNVPPAMLKPQLQSVQPLGDSYSQVTVLPPLKT